MTDPLPGTPSIPHLTELLHHIHHTLKKDTAGRLPDYIPGLAQADPDRFALCVALPDGTALQVGDVHSTFTLQSVCKPFSYLLALQGCGVGKVLQRVGTEPSGDPFNSIRLIEGKAHPDNPMVNAGALAVSDLLLQKHQGHALLEVQHMVERCLGHFPEIDQATFESEVQTAHRNRAIAHLMRNLGMLDHDPEQVLQLYLQQCALQVKVQDLAQLALTLACAGRSAVTGQQVFQPWVVRQTLSVMLSCGMYNSAGHWVCTVGLPAKSGVGVSGALLAVAPGRFGIAVYSPRLNLQGHSHRGVRACEMLSSHLNLHPFQLEVGR